MVDHVPRRERPTLFQRRFALVTNLWGALLLLALVQHAMGMRLPLGEAFLHRLMDVFGAGYLSVFRSIFLIFPSLFVWGGLALAGAAGLLFMGVRVGWKVWGEGAATGWQGLLLRGAFLFLGVILPQGGMGALIWANAGQPRLFWKVLVLAVGMYTFAAVIWRGGYVPARIASLSGVLVGLLGGMTLISLFFMPDVPVVRWGFAGGVGMLTVGLLFFGEIVFPASLGKGWASYGETSILAFAVGYLCLVASHNGVVSSPPTPTPEARLIVPYQRLPEDQLPGYFEAVLTPGEDALLIAGGYAGSFFRVDLKTGERTVVAKGKYAQRLAPTLDGQVAGTLTWSDKIAWYNQGKVDYTDVSKECSWPNIIRTDPGTGLVWVDCEKIPAVLALDPRTHSVVQNYAFPPGQFVPLTPAFDPEHHRVFFHNLNTPLTFNAEVYAMDSTTAQPLGHFALDNSMLCQRYCRATRRLYGASVVRSVILVADPLKEVVEREVQVPFYPRELSIWEEKSLMAVGCYYDGIVQIYRLTPTSETLLKEYHVGNQLRGVSFEGPPDHKRLLAVSMMGVWELELPPGI